MTKRYRHWCLNGCGKKVIFTGWRNRNHRFMCSACDRVYASKEELKGVIDV